MAEALNPRPAALPRHLSLYMDALRFGAAAVVFLGHYGTRRISGGLTFRFVPLGPAAVDVFFVLSGFVIAHVAATREGGMDFATRRAARILSVVVPALVLTAVLDAIGMAANPELYALAPGFDPSHPLAGYAASLLFLNEIWFRAAMPGTNLPFWSLGFEVWYYVLFGLAWFARGLGRWVGVSFVLLLVGPKAILLLPVWLFGVAARRLCAGPAPSRAVAWALAASPLVFLLWTSGLKPEWEPYHVFNWADPALPQAGKDIAIGLVVALHLVGVRWIGHTLPTLPDWAAGSVRWLAGCTFGVYLLHYPLIHCLAAILPWAPGTWPSRAIIGIGAPVAVLLLARAIERQKEAWRQAIRWLFALPRRAPRGVP